MSFYLLRYFVLRPLSGRLEAPFTRRQVLFEAYADARARFVELVGEASQAEDEIRTGKRNNRPGLQYVEFDRLQLSGSKTALVIAAFNHELDDFAERTSIRRWSPKSDRRPLSLFEDIA